MNKIILSIKAYLAILIVIIAVAFGVLWIYIEKKQNEINTHILEMNQEIAYRDVLSSIEKVSEQFYSARQELLLWDEVRQQLADPRYYEYWRSNRLIRSGRLPKLVEYVGVYDGKGNRLSDNISDVLPDTYLEMLDGGLIGNIDGKNYFLFGFPVNDFNVKKTLGYIALGASFHTAIANTTTVTSFKPEDVALSVPEGQFIRIDELKNHLDIVIKETPVAIKLHEFISNSLTNFLFISAALALLVWVLVSRILVNPLRDLSSYIDCLHTDDGSHCATTDVNTILVEEIVKTRDSLTAFHKNLATRNKELKDSESNLKVILDNLPDGVLALNRTGTIQSVNPAAVRLFGRSGPELIGKPLSDFIEQQQGSSSEANIMRRDGTRFPAETAYGATLQDDNTTIVIVRDISERKRSEEKLIKLANFDPLTNLPNRTLMRDRLLQAFNRAERKKNMVGLLYIDVDRFKDINDTLGHQIGDEFLVKISEALTDNFRDADTIARLGGDDFTMIIEDFSDTNHLSDIATRILEIVSKPVTLDGRKVTVTTSIGISVYPNDDKDPDRIIKNAETAMYKAKDSGRNGYQYFTPDLNTNALERMELENDLRQALEHNQFVLYYQPRILLDSNKVVGAEALLRWQHPTRGLIPPMKFIPILEDTRMIIQVGEWVLRTACQQAMQWVKDGHDPVRVSVNLSAVQFRDRALLQTVKDIMDETGMIPDLLELEITESLLVDNVSEAIRILNEFNDMGVSISIDDFGTGYSSLNYLKQFPIDTLKIDRSFVSDIPADEDACSIARAIIALSRSLRLKVTAEGIETAEQAEFLNQNDCDEGQGFLYAAPIPVKEFTEAFLGSADQVKHKA